MRVDQEEESIRSEQKEEMPTESSGRWFAGGCGGCIGSFRLWGTGLGCCGVGHNRGMKQALRQCASPIRKW